MSFLPWVPTAGSITLPVPVADGGTGQTTANAGFDALSPMTTAGDLLIEDATPTAIRLAVGSSSQVLGVSGGLPAWVAKPTGTVTSVAAGDTSIVVGGTGAAPTVETGTLDVIAADHPPAGAVAMNAQKITGLAAGSASTDAANFGQVLTRVASAGSAGYTMINGTGNVITWTAPNDGALHSVAVFGEVKVGSTQTGGAISLTWTYPDASTSPTATISAGGLATGFHALGTPYNIQVAPNTTVTIAQSSALTAGSAILFIGLWAA